MSRQQHQSRHGTTLVEAAMILPVFLFFMLASIEFGHAQMVNKVLNSACRKAARIVLTETKIQNAVDASAMAAAQKITVADLEAQLIEAFRNIAAKVPPAKLVYDLSGGNESVITCDRPWPSGSRWCSRVVLVS